MANDRKQEYLDDDEFEDDFSDFEFEGSDDSDDLDFHERKSSKKHKKSKSHRNARRSLEDYFERKALKDDDWEYDLDYE